MTIYVKNVDTVIDAGINRINNIYIDNICAVNTVYIYRDSIYRKIFSGGLNISFYVNWAGVGYSWGENAQGQLGQNSKSPESSSVLTPKTIYGIHTFVAISAGELNGWGIDNTGLAWSWGNNVHGQLGNNTTSAKSTPVSVLGVRKTFCAITSGDDFCCAVNHLGEVWSWGYNSLAQLGNNDQFHSDQSIPDLIWNGNNKTFCKIASGNAFSLAINMHGQLWAWGDNRVGQLGVNSTIQKYTPSSVLGNPKTFCEIATGQWNTPTLADHSLGIDYLGKIWAWGYNCYGQLGLGVSSPTSLSVLSPKVIYGNKTFCKIAGGENFSTAIDHNGQIWTWGNNHVGQLGNNERSKGENTPISIHGAPKTFCYIECGYNYVLAMDYIGRLWSWGSGVSGALGLGNTTSRCTPTLISRL